MRYKCTNKRCEGKGYVDFLGTYRKDLEQGPLFLEKRLTTYEISEDNDTLGWIEREDTNDPVVCAYCNKPAKVIAP